MGIPILVKWNPYIENPQSAEILVILNNHMNFEENNVQSKVIAVPADGLAPSGARSSAGRSMTKFVSHIYTGP